jgi:sugar transferase (PEP-CTERM system associated)
MSAGARFAPTAGLTRRTTPIPGLVLFWLDTAFLILAWRAAVLIAGDASAIGLPGLLFPAAVLLFLYALGLYRREALVEGRRLLGRLPLAAGFGAVTAWLAVSALPGASHIGAQLLFLASVPCFAAACLLARLIMFVLVRAGAFRRRLFVIGAGRRAWDLVWILQHEARTLAFDVTFCHGPTMGEVDARLAAEPAHRIVSDSRGLLEAVLEAAPEQIVVAPDERRGLAMDGLLACKMAGFPVSEYSQFLEREVGRIDLKRLDMAWLLYTQGFTMGTMDRIAKRALDILVSAALLVFTAPCLLLAALAVKLNDRGPVLYRQTRVTRGDKLFGIFKLRTMTTNAEKSGAVWAAEADPRITRIGRFLRRTRLDELPQLFNVLRGDMSFVGPRPERPEFTEDLATRLPLYRERHLVRAGLTGWAQVNYPYGASLNDARSKLSYDLYYVKNFGILLDLLIMLQTVRVVFWPGGVR